LSVALATIGFTSTIAQITLMREMVATFYGNELLFGLVLMTWLAWVAIGSWGIARLAFVQRLGLKSFGVVLILTGTLLPIEIVLVRNVSTLLNVTPGSYIDFGSMIAAVVTILAPLCVLSGFLFAFGARLTIERGGTAGYAYVWESLGSVAGGVLFSFVLIRLLDPFQSSLILAALNFIVAANILFDHPTASLSRMLLSLALLVLLIAFLMPLGRSLQEATLEDQWTDLAFSGDSQYGRITIQKRDSQRIFFENGMLAFETQGTFPEEVIHFPLLIHPAPRSVLLIGGGVAGDLREILKHPVSNLTYVELDPLLIEAARAHLPWEEATVLTDPRVTIVLSDGRLFVKQTEKKFDVIILDLPEPATGALNRFYTKEFFIEVKTILKPGGIFSLGLPSAENYWSPELARRNGSVFQTLLTVLPEILVLPGEHNFFITSETPLESGPTILLSRLSQRGIETHWVTPGYIEYVFSTDRFTEIRQELDNASGLRINRDLTPICYYYDLVLWLSRFYPNLRGIFEGVSLVNIWWVVVPLVIVVTLTRWRRKFALPFVVAGTGLSQMTLQVVILFAFQVLHGYLYAEVSLMVTMFMAGLVLGGAVSNRLLTTYRTIELEKKVKRSMILVQVAIIIFSIVFPLILLLPSPTPTSLFPLLALVAGGLVGMVFPLAVAITQSNTINTVGMLYGTDLLGGCVGALLSTGLFIPVLGIPQTCAIVALVGVSGLLALMM
jgi:spermidine synthase